MRFLFPIKYKFLVVISLVLFVALGAFFYVSYRTFADDKKLFVMDLNLTIITAAQNELHFAIQKRLEEIQVLAPRIYHPQVATVTAEKKNPYFGLSDSIEREIIAIRFYQERKDGSYKLARNYTNKKSLKARELKDNFPQLLYDNFPMDIKSLGQKEGLFVVNRSLRVNSIPVPVLTLVTSASLAGQNNSKLLVIVDLFQDFLRKKLDRSEIAELFLLNKKGHVISHPSMAIMTAFAGKPLPHSILPRLQRQLFPKESFELQVGGQPYLVNVTKTGLREVFLVSQIRKKQVFLALNILLRKAGYLAMLIYSACVVVSVLFAGQLTHNIVKLKTAAEEIGAGNFDIQLAIRSNDELRSVADSFQWMATRITELLAETANKARMENELKTAHLVQTTLLKQDEVVSDLIEMAPYYMSASECGGDFWDASINEKTVTLVIGDATGHGAAAALVTAVAKSCLVTLNRLYRNKPLTPEIFLAFLNQIIYETCKGELLMTMTIIQLNLETGKLAVCSAGHESPLCLRKAKSIEVQNKGRKKQIKPDVLLARGERLGFAVNTRYETKHFQLEIGDVLLLYSDGISEAHNLDGKEWGERKLRKTFAEAGARPISKIKDDLVNGMAEHTKGEEQKDDITFVLMRWRKPYQIEEAKKEVA